MIHMTHPLSSPDISIFLQEISKFWYIKKYRYRFHLDRKFIILLTFLESLRIALINLVTILMMSTKMATQSLLKINIFWKNVHAVMISVHNITSKILSRDSNYNVNMAMWPKFGKCSIWVREISKPQIYKDLIRKAAF